MEKVFKGSQGELCGEECTSNACKLLLLMRAEISANVRRRTIEIYQGFNERLSETDETKVSHKALATASICSMVVVFKHEEKA